MLKGSIDQQDTTIINIYTSNMGASKYRKLVLADQKGKVDSNTTIAGDFNTPISTMDKSSGQKFNKETLDLNYMLDQMS